MKTHSITKILAAAAMMLLASCATRSHHATNLSGVWSNEGDIKVNHSAEVDIQQTRSSFDGTIRIEEYDRDGALRYSSGLGSIVDGTVVGNRGSFDIYSQGGKRVGSGRLVSRGSDLKYRVKIDGRTYKGVLWPVSGK